MGIYDRKTGFDFHFGFAEIKKLSIGIGIVAILVVGVLLAFWIANLFQPKQLAYWFENNASELPRNSQTFLYVKVTNTTDAELSNIVVSAKAVDEAALHVSATPEGSNSVNVLGQRENRVIRFLVKPRTGVLPGAYSIEISATAESKNYASATATLQIT